MLFRSYLDPGNPDLVKKQQVVARLCLVASLGFLLLIPLRMYQIFSVQQTLGSVQDRRVNQGLRTVSKIKEALKQASSREDLERLLAELRLGREAERLPKRIDHLANTTGLQPTEIENRIRMARQAASRRAVRRVDAARLIRLLSELRPRTAHSGGSPPPLVGSSQNS